MKRKLLRWSWKCQEIAGKCRLAECSTAGLHLERRSYVCVATFCFWRYFSLSCVWLRAWLEAAGSGRGKKRKNAEEHEIVAVTKRGGKRAWGVASKQIHGNITQCPGTRPEQWLFVHPSSRQSDVSCTCIVLCVETIRIPLAKGGGPPGGANVCDDRYIDFSMAMNLEIRP